MRSMKMMIEEDEKDMKKMLDLIFYLQKATNHLDIFQKWCCNLID